MSYRKLELVFEAVLAYRYSLLFHSLQNVLFLVSVALMQMSCCPLTMSCQNEPQHGGEVIVAVCVLPELYIFIIIIIMIIILYNI